MTPVRVLLADDEAEFALGLSKVLARRGCAVDVRPDGASAIAAAAAGGYDVVLLDVKMPDMDGIAVLAELRRRSPGLRAILMTGRLAVGDEERGLGAGAFAYVLKPHPIEDLAALIRRAAVPAGPAGDA
jgi:DNA-binding response OmpR family regulator